VHARELLRRVLPPPFIPRKSKRFAFRVVRENSRISGLQTIDLVLTWGLVGTQLEAVLLDEALFDRHSRHQVLPRNALCRVAPRGSQIDAFPPIPLQKIRRIDKQ